MWNALQGATANIANRATRLAADVLETASEELKNGPEGAQSHHKRTDSSDSRASTGNARLAALKARYKGGGNGSSGPQSLPVDYRAREFRRAQSPGLAVGTPKHEHGPPESNGNHAMVLSALDENSDVLKLKDQLSRLKAELVQQSISHEDEVKQREYDFKEGLKALEIKHRGDLEEVRSTGHGAVDSTKHLEQKDAEIQRLKEQIYNGQQQDINQTFSLQPTQGHMGNSNDEVEFLRAQLVEVGYEELNAQSLQDLISSKDEEIEKLEVQLDAFRLSDPHAATSKLMEERDLLQSQLNAAKDASFFENIDRDETNNGLTISELQKRIHELTAECSHLRKSASTSNLEDALVERDAHWRHQLEQEQSSHRDTQAKLQEHLENEHQRQQVQSDEASKAQRTMEEMQNSLEGRDRIWQEELVKAQEELQRAKKEIEQLKLQQQQGTSYAESQMESLQHEYSSLKEKFEACLKDLSNEQDLRKGAEAHVKTMQKSMESHVVQADASRGLVQEELQEHRLLYATLEQKLVAVQEGLRLETERLRASEDARLIAEDGLESTSAHVAQLQQELELLKTSGNPGAEISAYDGTAVAEAAQVQVAEAQRENEALRHEIDDLRKQVLSGEERLQIALEHQKGHGVDTEVDAAAVMQRRVTELELERNRLKEQLNRLKRQMLSIQEDQESSIGWRIDAEVKLAVEEVRQKEAEARSKLVNRITELEGALDAQGGSEKKLADACKEKDVEIDNLQSVLGELTFHSEAAEKLRRDLRESKQEIDHLREELNNSKSEVVEAQSARRAAEASADRANKAADLAKERETTREGEVINLKRALLESSSRVTSMSEDAGSMVDRRIVVSLLVAYLEQRNSYEALGLMAKMLNFTEEERKRVGLDGSRRGLVGALTGGTMALVRGGVSVATLGMYGRSSNHGKPGESLADRWVEFLLKEADVETQARRDFHEDPLTLLKEEDPFGSKSVQHASSPDRSKAGGAGIINGGYPASQALAGYSPGQISTPVGAQASPRQAYPLPPSSLQHNAMHVASQNPTSGRDASMVVPSMGISYSDRAPAMPQYQPRLANGMTHGFEGAQQSTMPMPPGGYSPTASSPGAKMSSAGGSMSSLRDYMAKYHSNG